MNNFELTTDIFNTTKHRYKKKFSWKAFKKFGYIKGQVLCQNYDIILTDHKTPMELYKERFDKAFTFAIKAAKKIAAGSPEKAKRTKIFNKKKVNLDIFPKGNVNFKKMDNDLLGKKRKLF